MVWVTSERPGNGRAHLSGGPRCFLTPVPWPAKRDRRGSNLGLALRGGWCLLGEWRSSTQQLKDAESKVAGDMKRSPKADEADLGSCPAGRELGSCDEGLRRAGCSQALSEYAFSVVVVAAAAAERELRILSANISIF